MLSKADSNHHKQNQNLFEPPQTEPKPVVLPLHHWTITGAKVVVFYATTKKNGDFLVFYGEQIVIFLAALHYEILPVD